MLNKITSIAAAAGLSLITVSAMALDEVPHTIQLSATVPSQDFMVVPVDQAATTAVQTLAYNAGTNTFDQYVTQFTVKATTSAVKAKLAGAASLYSGTNPMALMVKFNNVVLGTDALEVVTKDVAGMGKNFPLSIAVTQDDPPAGTYSGSVSVIFESTI